MEPKRVSETRVELAQIMEPNDANFLGKVFGGSILAMIDLCAYATSTRFAGRVCVTASFDRVDFHSPIDVGDLVTMSGTVTYAGRTSVEVTIEIYSENLRTAVKRHTNTARVTMVAIGEDLKPTPVPGLVCESREDKVGFLEGRLRREVRGKRLAEFEAVSDRIERATDAELDAMLAAPTLL